MPRFRRNRIRWQANRPDSNLSTEGRLPEQECVPADPIKLELRNSLQRLAETINETIRLLDRFEGRLTEPIERRFEGGRMRDRLIPTRRSELLAKIDDRRPFRRPN